VIRLTIGFQVERLLVKKIKFNVELSFIDLTKNADLESLEFGIYLSQYSFDYFKSDIGEDYQIDIESSTFSEEIRNKIDSIFWTRDMVNYPALTKSPSFFEEQVKQLIKDTVIKLSSFDDVWLEKNNFGGITGVGSGSERKPKLLVGEYNPDAEFQI